jgi:hypothetical protein
MKTPTPADIEHRKQKRREAAKRAYAKRIRIELESQGYTFAEDNPPTTHYTGEKMATLTEKQRDGRRASTVKYRAKKGQHIDELTGYATGRFKYTVEPPPGMQICPGISLGQVRYPHLAPEDQFYFGQAYCKKCRRDYQWWKRRDNNGELLSGGVGRPTNLARLYKDKK